MGKVWGMGLNLRGNREGLRRVWRGSTSLPFPSVAADEGAPPHRRRSPPREQRLVRGATELSPGTPGPGAPGKTGPSRRWERGLACYQKRGTCFTIADLGSASSDSAGRLFPTMEYLGAECPLPNLLAELVPPSVEELRAVRSAPLRQSDC